MQKCQSFKLLMFNSREAIAAIIADIVVFFNNSMNLNCIGALSFYKDMFTYFYDF